MKCRQCEKEFKPHRAGQLYCCMDCQRKYNGKISAAKKEETKREAVPANHLEEMVEQAEKAGMSYGKYMEWRERNK